MIKVLKILQWWKLLLACFCVSEVTQTLQMDGFWFHSRSNHVGIHRRS